MPVYDRVRDWNSFAVPLPDFFSLLKCLKLNRASSYLAFPRTILGLIYISFLAARLSGTCLLMSACCNSVNKSNLQFSGRDVYLQTERLRSLAQFLKHVIIPQKRQVFHYKYSKTPHWRFQNKSDRESENRSNTSSFLTREAVSPMTGSDFDWMLLNPAVWGWKVLAKASVSGVFSPSALSLFCFHLSPFSSETPHTQAKERLLYSNC